MITSIVLFMTIIVLLLHASWWRQVQHQILFISNNGLQVGFLFHKLFDVLILSSELVGHLVVVSHVTS